MKKLKIKNITLTAAILLLMLAPFTSLASDKWSETPDFDHETKIESVITEPAISTNYRQVIDLWAETPDLSKEGVAQDVFVEIPSRRINHLHQDMYTETPDLSLS